MAQALRAGVLGVGSLGRYHAQKYAAHDETELVGVFDPDPERARSVAEEVGAEAFTAIEGLLDRVEAVTIAAPTEVHRELGVQCLERGIHVLMEKPITANLDEADALIHAADQSGAVLQVGHLKRFHPTVQAIRQNGWDDEPPRYIEAERLNLFQARSLDIDVILDLMVHDLDLINELVRSPAREVRAIGIPVVTDKVDMANARIAFENGTVANVTASRVSRKQIREMRLFQPHRYLSLNFVQPSIGVYQLDPASEDGPIPGVSGGERELPKVDLLAEEVAAFVHACQGRPSEGVSGREARDALSLAVQVGEAIAEQQQEVSPT
jgi:predicted dehydrogenase